MLDEAILKEVAPFIDRKTVQWGKFSNALPHLQLIQAGDHAQFMLVYSTEEFYEGIVIGQLPRIQIAGKGRIVPEAQRRAENQRIDLSDDQIDAVLVYWEDGKSALELPFIKSVWNREGREVRK